MQVLTRPRDDAADRADLLALDAKINALLPPQYQNHYEEVNPESMGSAELKFGPDGKVAWDEIWTTYCHLALAGGPPHRGTILEPASHAEVRAEPAKYQEVVAEIGRGLWLVTALPILPMAAPGWVGVICRAETMAAWLHRAIVAENVWARHEGRTLFLPAGPHFRLAGEIKNVVTALAKTCHYWSEHIPEERRCALDLPPLIEAALPNEVRADPKAIEAMAHAMEQHIGQATGLTAFSQHPPGWLGVPLASEQQAVWLMRAMIAQRVLARRQKNVLFLPVNRDLGGDGKMRAVLEDFARANRLWRFRTEGEQ